MPSVPKRTLSGGRLATLAVALELDAGSGRSGRTAVAERLALRDPGDVWLALAVLRAKLPTPDEVMKALREITYVGAPKALRRILRRQPLLSRLVPALGRRVEVTGQTLVDVHHTAKTPLATGIQRVTRNVTREWEREHDTLLIQWDNKGQVLRPLSDGQYKSLIGHPRAAGIGHSSRTVVVPWRATYILPELAVESARTLRLAAMSEYSKTRCAAIGFDCVPLTTSETVAPGMGGLFSGYLAALATFDKVAAISAGARDEFHGWTTMLVGTGRRGPDVTEVLLATEVGASSDDDLTAVRRVLGCETLPLILCVGSHEPRKNHLAVLQAAEMLWRQGHGFSLGMIGGNAWNARAFQVAVKGLIGKGRPITVVTGASDPLLWASYRIAKFTVFPSLNEGFGLPVAESLAAGTPVVTSKFGSMREIADQGGAVLVDPRDDDDIARGIEILLTSPRLRRELHLQAIARPPRTWALYAREVWEYVFAVP